MNDNTINQMLESAARTIIQMANPTYIDMLTEEEVASFRREYRMAYLKLYGSILNEDELHEHIAVGNRHCIVCRNDTCRCIQRAEPYIKKYGSMWCRSCGYKYYGGGEEIPWFFIDAEGTVIRTVEHDLERVDETTWRLPDGRLYRMYYPHVRRRRVPCSDCSPVFVDSMLKTLEGEQTDRC